MDKNTAPFIYVGRLEKIKGVELLLKAWRDMKDFQLLICGSGSLEDWCHTYKNLHGMDSVTFTGQLHRDRAQELIEKSTALILPTVWYEGFPMTILEAYRVGTPVIVPDMGNAGALVREGITGYHYRPLDMQSLQRAVYRTYQNADRLRDSTLSFGRAHYRDTDNYDTLMTIYAQAVKGISNSIGQ